MTKKLDIQVRVQHDDSIILILGLTGAGRSTFINAAAGKTATQVGHGMHSCTTTVQPIFVPHPKSPKHRVVLVDTPGFNDMKNNDADTLKTIINWLKPLDKAGIKLSGFIYLHDITQSSIVPSSDSLAMLQSLSKEVIKHAVLATTHWSRALGDEGDFREAELCQEHWTSLLCDGAGRKRFMDTHESAWEIIDLLREDHKISPGLLRTELETFRNRLGDRPGSDGLLSLLRNLLGQGKW